MLCKSKHKVTGGLSTANVSGSQHKCSCAMVGAVGINTLCKLPMVMVTTPAVDKNRIYEKTYTALLSVSLQPPKLVTFPSYVLTRAWITEP